MAKSEIETAARDSWFARVGASFDAAADRGIVYREPGRDTVVNVTAPVVTPSTAANLGRELRGVVDRAMPAEPEPLKVGERIEVMTFRGWRVAIVESAPTASDLGTGRYETPVALGDGSHVAHCYLPLEAVPWVRRAAAVPGETPKPKGWTEIKPTLERPLPPDPESPVTYTCATCSGKLRERGDIRVHYGLCGHAIEPASVERKLVSADTAEGEYMGDGFVPLDNTLALALTADRPREWLWRAEGYDVEHWHPLRDHAIREWRKALADRQRDEDEDDRVELSGAGAVSMQVDVELDEAGRFIVHSAEYVPSDTVSLGGSAPGSQVIGTVDSVDDEAGTMSVRLNFA